MAWTLEAAYARTGLDETPENDALLTGVMTATVAVVEMWLNRKLQYAVESESFPMVYAPTTLTLRRYPLEEITGIYFAGDQMSLPITPGNYRLTQRFVADPETGLLFFPSPLARNSITVQYTGGYVEFPPDLELALWLVFDKVYADGFGGGGSGGTVGEVSSITVPDVGTVRFATATSVSIDAASSGDYNGMIPISAMGILNLYRRETV